MDVLLVVEQLRRGLPDGISTYTLGLLQGLDAMGAVGPNVTLHASRSSEEPDPLERLGHPILASALPGQLLTLAWDRGLRPAPGAGGIVHSTSLAFPPVGSGRRLSVMVHDLAWRDVPEAYPRRGRRWHEKALQRALAGGHLLLAPSRAVADDLVAAGARADQVDVIEEGCDHLPPADVDSAEALLTKLGVREGFLLTVGTLQPRKNLLRLLDAYAIARSELPEPWPLVVVGPSGWGDSISPSSIPHGVVLAGAVQGAVLAGLYRKARCLAYVPLVEGFGLPPVEAMRECTPVVASRVPSTAGAALEVDPSDTRVIATALVAAAADDRVRSELVTAGLLRSSELTWEAAARRHVELWTAIAE